MYNYRRQERIPRPTSQLAPPSLVMPRQAPGMPGMGFTNTPSAQDVYSTSMPWTPPPTQQQRQQDFDFQQSLANPFRQDASLMRQQELADFANQANMTFQNPQDMSNFFTQGMGLEPKYAPDLRPPVSAPTLTQQQVNAQSMAQYGTLPSKDVFKDPRTGTLTNVSPEAYQQKYNAIQPGAGMSPFKQGFAEMQGILTPEQIARKSQLAQKMWGGTKGIESSEALYAQNKALKAQQAANVQQQFENEVANLKARSPYDEKLIDLEIKKLDTDLANGKLDKASHDTLRTLTMQYFTARTPLLKEYSDIAAKYYEAKQTYEGLQDVPQVKVIAQALADLDAEKESWSAQATQGGEAPITADSLPLELDEALKTSNNDYDGIIGRIPQLIPLELQKQAIDYVNSKRKKPTGKTPSKPIPQKLTPKPSTTIPRETIKPPSVEKPLGARPKPTPGIASKKYTYENKGYYQTAKEIVEEFPNSSPAELENVVGRDLGWSSPAGKGINAEIQKILKRKNITVGKGTNFIPAFIPPKAF